MSPSTAGALRSPSLFSGVSLVLTMIVEGPGHCGPAVFVAEELEWHRKQGVRMLMMLRHLDLGLFSTIAKGLRFLE